MHRLRGGVVLWQGKPTQTKAGFTAIGLPELDLQGKVDFTRKRVLQDLLGTRTGWGEACCRKSVWKDQWEQTAVSLAV